MTKYKNRVMMGTLFYLPILIMVWVVPYAPGAKNFVVAPIIWNGNPLYVFFILLLASVFQFFMGSHFYQSAWKSLQHKSANMDVLIVLSTTTAWLYGVALVFYGYTREE